MEGTLRSLEALHIEIYNCMQNHETISAEKLEKVVAKIITLANLEVSLHGNE